MTKEIQKQAAGTASLTVHLNKCPDNDVNEVLAYCGIVSGCMPPGQTELIVLRDWLRNKHPNYRVEHVKRAFDLYASGKLNVNFSHYGRISGMFLSIVLTAYKPFTQMAITDPERILTQNTVKRPINGKDSYEGMKTFVKMTNQLPTTGPWLIIFKWLETNTWYKDQYEFFENYAVQDINKEAESAVFRRIVTKKAHYVKEHSSDQNIKIRVAKLAVLDQLKQFKTK